MNEFAIRIQNDKDRQVKRVACNEAIVYRTFTS